MMYWKKRQEQYLRKLEKDEEALKKKLSGIYDRQTAKMERDIAAFYQKYGADKIVEYRKLTESLSKSDAQLLIEKTDEFIEKYPQYQYLVSVRENIYKLNRLEGIQYSIRLHQYEVGAINEQELKDYLEIQSLRGLNLTADVMGYGKNFYALNSDIVKFIASAPYAEGANFSKRIWQNTEKLAEYLTKDFAQGIARGDSYERLMRQLKERFGKVTRRDMYRLVFTEGTHVFAESTMKPFEQDFEEYRISTVGDGRVCPICRGMANETFRIKDRQAGVNFPPFHSWCRCIFEIAVNDWDKWMQDYVDRHGTIGDKIRKNLT